MEKPFIGWTCSEKANEKLNLAYAMESKGMSEEKVSGKIAEAITLERVELEIKG